MADVDFPSDGASEDTWGAELILFEARVRIMSGENGGLIANVINQGQFMTNQEQPLYNVPGV